MKWSFIPPSYESMKSKESSLFNYTGPYHSNPCSGVIQIASWQHQAMSLRATEFSDICWVRNLSPLIPNCFRALARVIILSIHGITSIYLLYHFASFMLIFDPHLINHPFYHSISYLSNHWLLWHLNKYMYSSKFSCDQCPCLFDNLCLLIMMHSFNHFISLILFLIKIH